MTDKHDKWADTLSGEHSGWLTGFLAEEDKIDRRMMWRLGSWGVAAVGAVVVAVLASQSQVQIRRDQVAASESFARQSQQIQFVAKETQVEARRLTLAIETLNSDRDRLYARVTSVEQGLDSVTGSIKRQSAPTTTAAVATRAPQPPATALGAVAPPVPEPRPVAELPGIPSTPIIGPVAAVPPTVVPPPAETPLARPAPTAASSSSSPPASAPLAAWKSMTAPPDAAAARSSEPAPAVEVAPAAPETTASIPPASEPAPAVVETMATPVARTEFGVDIGGANSVDGLRAIWRGMSRSRALNGLRPIMMVKERPTGLGMQLRLVAGPLTDAAAAAKICAALTESSRPCETTVFEGQRLAMKAEAAPAEAAPAPVRPAPRKRAVPKPQERTEQAPPKPAEDPAPPKPQSSLSSLLGIR